MARQGALVVLSLVVHGALGAGLSVIRPEQSRAATAIEIANVKQQKKAPPPRVEPPQVEPPKKRERKSVARSARPAPPPVAPPPEAPTRAPAQNVPDFGLTLSGGVEGAGLALPSGGSASPARPTRTEPVRRTAPALATNALPTDGCDEPSSKPKPKSVPQPSYPDSARAAGVEGRVRVELTVDESGRVVAVRVLQGLGHGLDEAAVDAARRATFEPALRCGKASRATFTISMRFSAI